MDQLLDKIILFVICLALYVSDISGLYVVVPVIVAIIASALGSYFDRLTARAAVMAAMVACTMIDSRFLFFLPLVCFDLAARRGQALLLLSLLPLVSHYQAIGLAVSLQIALLILLAWFLKSRSLSLQKLKLESTAQRDANKEEALRLELKNRELLERQDYEVNLATLGERNRIAREIHDNVGHLLTRAILITGALKAACREEATRDSLESLQNTLNESMDSIRTSLHDLHDQSIDLHSEILGMLRDFTFCPVRLDYDIEHSPDKKCKYAFLAIIREALANIVRHSQAGAAEITLREHPAFYQLIIRDNGRGLTGPLSEDSGIGLRSITERVASLGGLLNISGNDGFVLFITVPRQGHEKSFSTEAGT